MADQVFLNNISDDSKTKEYVSQQLMPRVFHNIPMNVLNVGQFSVVNEEMSQVMEQLGFTSAFYYNESFITKAVLPESIYAQAAIFNIGYSFANPSSCVMLLELKLSDIYNNATFNADSGLYEFILDKDTIINLSNGNSYSFDYDILIQYKNIETSQGTATIPAWSVRYINTDEANVVSINKKDPYIQYKVAQTWLCLYVKVREYTRTTYTVVNNMTNGIPNEDYLITTTEHMCGFDVRYIDGEGNSQWLDHDHILALHADVKDQQPYVHYIMDNPQTLRLKFQLQGSRYFVPALNSRYEIVVYTCHGQAANFSAWNPEDQPNVISNTSHYTNNGNVTKACHVVGASQTGTDIGTVETVRRETIEAYNTAKVISTDHDIEEWFKTFFFKNILYPFFYKRRDDPWGKIWAGFIALKDADDTIFRTNTLHGKIPYRVLYDNLGPNVMHEKEIIIPPGWIWVYPNAEENRYTISPYVASDSGLIETAKTLESIPNKFVFANPFGIRIQKDPFAIGYFNPWVSLFSPLTKIYTTYYNTTNTNDITTLYHASPINFLIDRTYMNDYYDINTHINPSMDAWIDGTPLVRNVRKNTVAPYFSNSMWSYFKQPIDLYVQNIPLMTLTERDGYLPFIPERTYLCVGTKNRIDDDRWALNNLWIEDYSEDPANPKRIAIPITGSVDMIYGLDSIWGNELIAQPVSTVESTDITIGGLNPSDPITFDRVTDRQYYEMRVANNASLGAIEKIIVDSVTETDLTKYGESRLWRIGNRYQSHVFINVYFQNSNDEASIVRRYDIGNAADVYIPYAPTRVDENNLYVFELSNVAAGGIILYADMKPSATDGAIDHYRVNFNDIPYNVSLFYVKNSILPTEKNNMRVVLHAAIDGIETGWVEMQPVQKETDGTYLFNIPAYPLNGLVDIDNRIHIASVDNGGGSWNPRTSGSYVNIDASKPEFTVSILIRTQDSTFDPGLNLDNSFLGFRCVDQYSVDDISLVQELKEMRSVVNWGDSSEPTQEDLKAYDNLLSLGVYDASTYNLFTIAQYYYELFTAGEAVVMTFAQLIQTGNSMLHGEKSIDTYAEQYTLSDKLDFLYRLTSQICTTATSNADIIDIMKTMDSSLLDKTDQEIWGHMYDLYNAYASDVDDMFTPYGVNNGVEIQLMPVVESALMTNASFKTFVAAFTQVHTAIEPVIFNRLEGNNYLDCKLIATYGLPHSYCSDVDKELETAFWPNLDVQIAFDVKLYNTSLTMNTLNELRIMIKSYFNRLTTVHTPLDIISMDNNIYISQLIRSMESHPNVAYLKFKGWYTNEKGDPDGNYMNADYQAIVQKWDTLEEMPTDELERYVPEMFVLEDKNIVLNAI
jgi:hypothetical protein